METLRVMLRQIGERFALLDTSQRVAIGLCTVLIAVSLSWLAQWSTAPEMVSVFAQDVTLDQLDAAEEALTEGGLKFQRVGGRLMVRPDDKYNAIRVLNKADALPQETSFGFAELLKRDTTFAQSSVLEHQRVVALSNELARVIKSSPAVEDAAVFIQHQNRRGLGAPTARSTASVKITMRPNQTITPTMVDACARLVANAVPGLSPHDVAVFDARTLAAHSVADPQDSLGQGLLEERKKNERHLLSKVLAQLTFIPGVLASVSVDLDAAKMQSTEMTYGDAEVRSEESRSSRGSGPTAGGESGVNPNVGVALSAATAGSGGETEEGRSENFEPKLTGKTVIDKAPFSVRRATASVSVPRSYVAGVFKAKFPDKADFRDTDREFIDVRTEIFTGVRDVVGNIIMGQAGDVQVDMFHDVEVADTSAPPGPEGAPPAASSPATAALWQERLPELGLGGLALVSLSMMLMMVRKSARVTRSWSASGASDAAGVRTFSSAGDELLAMNGGPVGRADVSEGFLVGKEVDQETLQYQQYDEQVARMVDDDPNGVADLLRRWVQPKE